MNNKPFKFLIIFLFIFALAWTLRGIISTISTQAPDFSVFYHTAADLIAGKNPYLNKQNFTGLGYPPNTLLFYIPFSLLPLKTAQAIFTLMSFFAVLLSVILALKLTGKKINPYYLLLLISLALLSFPTKFTLGMGQNNTIALLAVISSFYLYKKNKLPSSGIVLGLAVSLKTIFAFLLLYFILKKKWKIILYSFGTTLALVLLTILISDTNLYTYWITKVIPPLLNLEGREIYYNQSFLGFVSRLTDNLQIRKFLSLLITIITVAVTSILSTRGKKDSLQFSLFFITLLLIDTLSWQHHFVWLIFPFIAITAKLTNKHKYSKTFLFLLYLAISWNFKQPELLSSFPLSLLLSHVFFATLLLYTLNLKLIIKNS